MTTPDRRRGRTLSPGARGANHTTHHGPLQRLLDGMAQLVSRLAVAHCLLKGREPARILPHAEMV